MLTWLGLIGRTIEYVGRKLLDKNIDVSFDKKGKAAREMLAFYHCLYEVEDCTRKLIDALSIPEDKPVIFAMKVIELTPEIHTVSEKFVEVANRLAPAIEIYDPRLAQLLFVLYEGKGVFQKRMVLFSDAKFEIRAKAARNLERISYNVPNDELNYLDLDQFYNSISEEHKINSASEQEVMYRPISIDEARFLRKTTASQAHQRLRELISRNIINAELHAGDIELITALKLQLEHHLTVVKNARELIRQFISGAFTIDDLLYHTPKSNPGLKRF